MAVLSPYKETLVTYSNEVSQANSDFRFTDANVTYVNSDGKRYVESISITISDKDGLIKQNCSMVIEEDELPTLIELLQHVQGEITKWNEKNVTKNGD